MSTATVEQAFAPETTVTVRIDDKPITVTVDWQGTTVEQIQEMAARYVLTRTKPTGKQKAAGTAKARPKDGERVKAADYLPRGTRQAIPAALVKKIQALPAADRAAILALLGEDASG